MNHITKNPSITLVIGGHGKTGRRVAQRLAAAGRATRVVSRSTELPFDWHDESTWGLALAGTSSAYVTFHPDITVPGAVEIITAFGAAAREQGLDHLVLLSGRGEEQAQACEVALAESGVTTTIVRSAFFAQNFSEGFLAGDVQASVFALPAGDVTEPIVDIDDVADVAVAALLGQVQSGRVYELTGPELLTFHDIAARPQQGDRSHDHLLARRHGGVRRRGGRGGSARRRGRDAGRAVRATSSTATTRRSPPASRKRWGALQRSFADFAVQAAATGVWDEVLS